MNSSILVTIKKMLGIASDYTAFDIDIITHINSALSILRQLGIGPASGFRITGTSETWENFVGSTQELEEVKTYIYLRVRKWFDPPASATVLEAYNNDMKELEWRLNVTVDPGEEID